MRSKIFAVLVLLMSAGGSINAVVLSDLSFSAGVSADYLTGEVREIVYPSSGWTNDYLSELIWQIDNIAMITGNFKAEYKNFSMDTTVSTALNKGTGEMDDYDWGDFSTGDWTNWSNSDIFLDKSLILDTSILYSVPKSDSVSFPLGLGYRLNYMSWTDKAREYIYKGTWDSSGSFYYFSEPDTGSFGGIPAISYMFVQNIVYGTAGASYESRRFGGAARGFFSPYIFTWDKDHHILRNLFFIDSFTSRIWYRLEGTLFYRISHSEKLQLSVSYEELPETRGDTDYYNEDPSDPDEPGSYIGTVLSSAGIASKIFRISIGYMYRF